MCRGKIRLTKDHMHGSLHGGGVRTLPMNVSRQTPVLEGSTFG